MNLNEQEANMISGQASRHLFESKNTNGLIQSGPAQTSKRTDIQLWKCTMCNYCALVFAQIANNRFPHLDPILADPGKKN